MAKNQSFAAKVAKASSERSGTECAKCGEKYTVVKLIVSEKDEIKDSWKFNQRFVPVCNCNQAEVYG